MIYSATRFLLPFVLLVHLVSQILLANIFSGHYLPHQTKQSKVILEQKASTSDSFVKNAEILRELHQFTMLNISEVD